MPTTWHRQTKHYYHVKCFAFMIDLASLLPQKFKLDVESGCWWGLMVEKWFEHSGRVDLDKIAKYLEDFDQFEAKQSEYNKWSETHASCTDQEAECRCPPRPDPPSEPELGDCTKEDGDACTLLDVLEHRFAMKRTGGEWEYDEGLI
ncbi:hypothetical protein C8A05DRAFT_20387 [Staphylotrichum tortipilum]|uniref:Uncharacterized protein n=1 Tax=Staphylotrichum tortipilum TaxID=2831512 RepID=A0AAN6RMW9_9PEZI|nr:hypothetical protein C8A05DRAFT_20387 [Staphylotrichum longicolle]